MVIDGKSCTNVVFEDLCKNLGLKTKPYLAPYKVAWVNNTNLKVSERCMLTYSMREFRDQVLCDVLHSSLSKCATSYLEDLDFMIRRPNIAGSRTLTLFATAIGR